jgi:hypothetical protein
MLTGVDVLGSHRDTAKSVLHVATRRGTVQAPPIGVTTPGGVDLGEVGVGAPLPAVDQWQQPGAVGARLGTEDPGTRPSIVTVRGEIGAIVRGDVVVLVTLLQPRNGVNRIVDQSDHVGKGIPEETGDAQHDVDAGPAELGQTDHLQAGDSA